MRNIGLALQGGGAYAAFTAGVLKGMFSGPEEFLNVKDIHSITGTSGGAMNAMLLGLAIHEKQANPAIYVERLWELNRLEKLLKEKFMIPEEVPDELLTFVIGMSRRLNTSNPVVASILNEYSKTRSFFNDAVNDILHHAAPSLPEDIDEVLFPDRKPFVTVASTEVKSAQAHYFTNNKGMIEKFQNLSISLRYNVLKELTLRGVYASLAHPYMFKSVEMGNDIYWDGYYTSNPPFFYLFREGCDEVFLVRLIQRSREDIGEDMDSVRDRAEEIVQNITLNMEIQMYLLMRELLVKDRGLKGLAFKLGTRKFTRSLVYHEIRLLKSGNISDEGYPLVDFVDKLIGMGRKVMTDSQGFVNTFRNRGKKEGLQVISEIDFEDEVVTSYCIDTDRFIFSERRVSSEISGESAVRRKMAYLKKKIKDALKAKKSGL